MKREAFLNLWIPVAIGVALLLYLIMRAALVPITHDEANTCLTFSVKPVWEILTYKDPIPNNHIVNTLLIKLFAAIFGMHAFIARLPNLLGFILYYSVIVIWLRKLSSNFIFILTGIVLFTCNPYLLDFFSLARGYALSIAFMITACYFGWKYLQTFNARDHLMAMIFSAIAVYTNFTMLNFFLAFTLLLLIADLQQFYKADHKRFYKLFSQTTIITGILALLSFYPIYRMVSTGQLVFWGTRGFYSDTLVTLVHSSAYGQAYFNLKPSSYVNIYIYFIFVIALFAVIRLRQLKYKFNQEAFPFFVILLIGTIVINILQFYMIRTPYLTARTALFYYPLSMVAVLFFLHYLLQNYKVGFRLFSSTFIFAGIFHLVNCLNLRYSFEWWFDQNNLEVISDLEDEHKLGNSVILDVNWLFFPSINFHVETDPLHKENIQMISFHTELDTNSTANYYYIFSGDYDQFKNNFDSIQTYDHGSRMLIRKK